IRMNMNTYLNAFLCAGQRPLFTACNMTLPDPVNTSWTCPPGISTVTVEARGGRRRRRHRGNRQHRKLLLRSHPGQSLRFGAERLSDVDVLTNQENTNIEGKR
ncbi:MAG: hypothetical protein AAF492_00565, partial [Verrucomicrobiota bacterium]